MSISYSITTAFGAKDSLASNDPDKVIKGSEFTTEFTAIQSAFALAAPAASPTFTGTATFDALTATGTTTLTTVDINGGAIDATTVGSTTPAAGAFTTLTATGTATLATVDINAGAIDGTAIGASSASTGAFTTLSASTSITGTLATAAQTNITSVGTLSALNVSGDLTVDTDTLYVNSANSRVGINTVSPASTLDIASSLPIIHLTATVGSYHRLYNDNGVLGIDADFNQGVAGSAITFSVDATERMRIDSSGRQYITNGPVGFSTGSAVEGLQSWWDGTNNVGYIYAGQAGVANYSINLGPIDGAVRIDSSGNVGIGTSSPSSYIGTSGQILVLGDATANPAFTLASSTSGVGDIVFADSADNDVGLIRYSHSSNYMSFTTNAAEAARIDSSGNLLVGKTSATSAGNGFFVAATGTGITTTGTYSLILRRDGTDGVIQYFSNDGTLVGNISVSGSTTAYNTSSDVRLKENITDADSSGSVIDAIQVRQYDWKADGSHQRYGFVAQELDLVYPEAVSKGETEDDTWGVDYSKLVPLLVKNVQELSAELNSVKAELEALKNA